MRRKATHQGEAADVNVTPLLDIVFIMLIFFIVTATFTHEKGINATSPEDNEDTNSIPPPALVLSILKDGFVQINGGRLIDPQSTKPVVEEFMAREPDGVVLVSAAPESESGIAVQVMDQAQDAGAMGRVSLTLQKEKK